MARINQDLSPTGLHAQILRVKVSYIIINQVTHIAIVAARVDGCVLQVVLALQDRYLLNRNSF